MGDRIYAGKVRDVAGLGLDLAELVNEADALFTQGTPRYKVRRKLMTESHEILEDLERAVKEAKDAYPNDVRDKSPAPT